jgi:hypothetical protein
MVLELGKLGDVRILHWELRKYRPYEILQETGHTPTFLVSGVKLSLFRATAPLFPMQFSTGTSELQAC